MIDQDEEVDVLNSFFESTHVVGNFIKKKSKKNRTASQDSISVVTESNFSSPIYSLASPINPNNIHSVNDLMHRVSSVSGSIPGYDGNNI